MVQRIIAATLPPSTVMTAPVLVRAFGQMDKGRRHVIAGDFAGQQVAAHIDLGVTPRARLRSATMVSVISPVRMRSGLTAFEVMPDAPCSTAYCRIQGHQRRFRGAVGAEIQARFTACFL